MVEPGKIEKLRRGSEAKANKRSAKKKALAESAIKTLSQLGYARTSLRDIAEQSGISVGVVHYYFEDKADLISYCVRIYKEEFVSTLDSITATAPDLESLLASFIDGLIDAVAHNAEIHRLWYDIRSQAMFDDVFQPVVGEIEQALMDLVERLLARIVDMNAAPSEISPRDAYLLFDNQFRYFLMRRLAGDVRAVEDYRSAVETAFQTYILRPV